MNEIVRPRQLLRRDRRTESLRRFGDAGVIAAVLTVFLVHFRPWQGGLLEDWGLALAWDQEGFGGFVSRLPMTLGRPLHLLPQYIGMAMSDGGFVGPYAVLGAVAVGQLLAARWAVAPLTSLRSLQWTLALAVALHPWWAAGDILRFLPAQVSVLACVVWFGASIRYLATGRWYWASVVVAVPLFGLLAYQAPAGALVMAAVLIALLRDTSIRRRITLVALTTAVVLAVVTWSVVLAPLYSSDSYEAQLESPSIALVASIRAILRTLALNAPTAVAALILVGAGVIALGFRQSLSAVHAWLLLFALAATPLAAFTYASQLAHLNDPERVALPVGFMIWVVACCALPALSRDRQVRLAGVVAALAGTALATVVGYGTWTTYAASQAVLVDSVQTVREAVPESARLVVSDPSGHFGDIYTLLPPHLNLALDAEYGPGADVELCTPAGVVRDHPTAAVYPIPTTPGCGALLDGIAVTSLGALKTSEGTFDVFELPAPE
ncbi:hypothetical protein [Pengzhenrongella frigida]|uniref:Glycosyltransferase RgtA/B/C/D-like domain-containing protein n=1 Tax=Pengzhenrongella frigida TaxID=1259133 RepID=A0A4Q5MZZ7_9MICO|nr:hypothetical protein [Cellulomonas sp. HLT2-17]RYV51339.1 hypothetical protein EUA98_08610 [Cellulomonas sp. HLT2-17]